MSQKYQQQYIALDNKPARWARLLFLCQCGIRSVKVPLGWTRVPWRLYWLPLKCGPTWNYLSIGIYRLFCKVYATIQRHKTVIAYCWFCSIPANTKHLYDICIMLVQRRRRWGDVVQMLHKCFVFAGKVLCIILGGLKETKLFLPHPRVKVSIVGSFRDREVACSASDRQGSNFESCVWRTVSSQSSHHPQEVLLAQFSLYVHKGGLKPDSFHFISFPLYYRVCCTLFYWACCTYLDYLCGM